MLQLKPRVEKRLYKYTFKQTIDNLPYHIFYEKIIKQFISLKGPCNSGENGKLSKLFVQQK